MALSFAPVALIAFHRRRRPLVVHALFSLHLYAFMLLLFCVATSIPPMNLWFGAGLTSDGLDHTLSIGLVAACAVYLHIATKVVYGASGAIRILKVLALTVGVAGIVLGYRFVLFLITLYST
jgi:hypothetical protein